MQETFVSVLSYVASMKYCMYSASLRSKTELDNGTVKWVKLVDNTEISINTYLCIDAIIALKYNAVDLCGCSIKFTINLLIMTLNREKSMGNRQFSKISTKNFKQTVTLFRPIRSLQCSW